MRYRLVSLMGSYTTVLTLAAAAAQIGSPLVADQHEFDEIAPLVDQLRRGAGSNLVVQMSPNNFEILTDVTTPITSNEARLARAELRKVKPGLPVIRFTRSHEIAVYELDERTTIEVEVDTTPEKWIRRTSEKTASYPNSAWQRFVKFGLRNGLTELTFYDQGTARVAEVTLAAVERAACHYPGGSLHFSPEFYDHMRLSPDYAESTGTNGFVVLIQDPRQYVSGRFRLMSGLAALFAANSNIGFEYLVEGAEKPAGTDPIVRGSVEERAMSDGGLGDYLQRFPEPQRKRIVNSMLRQSLIDTPLAFQLVRPREPQIHGMAIDANRHLNESPMLFVEPSRIQAALKALAEIAAPKDRANMDSEESAARGMILEGIYMTTALQQADSMNLSATQLIKHLERLKAGFGALGDVATEISKSFPEMQAHADALAKESAAYSDEVEKCRNALKHNETMLAFIETAGRSSAKKVPLVFIGSDHTEDITRQLRNDGISYLVIEPRTSGPYNHSVRGQQRLENFLDDVRTSNAPCSLTGEQVRTRYIPFINTILSDVNARQNNTLNATDMGNIDLNRLQLAVASNGWLLDSVVEIAKVNPGARDAGMPAGAFAFLREVDGKRRLVLLDKDSEHWREEDRYAQIADAIFAVPHVSEGQAPVIHFVHHTGGSSSSREYFSVYKSDSKRVYLVEGSISSAAALLSLSTARRTPDGQQ